MKNIFTICILTCLLMGCSQSETPTQSAAATSQHKAATANDATKPTAKPVSVIIKTSKGDIELELYPSKAPKTVANFLKYVDQGFYNGTIFHRVIRNFMIQGGGFLPGMKQKSGGKPITNEADNGLENQRGTIAMARTSAPHSATAQFFINVANNRMLNFTSPDARGYGYCVFGKVTQGMTVVDQIRNTQTSKVSYFSDVPKQDIMIKTITRK